MKLLTLALFVDFGLNYNDWPCFPLQLSQLTDLVKLMDSTFHYLSGSSRTESRTPVSKSSIECDRKSVELCLGYFILNWRITPRFLPDLRSVGPPRTSSSCRTNLQRTVLAGKVRSTFWKALSFFVLLNIWSESATLHKRWRCSRLTLDKCCTW